MREFLASLALACAVADGVCWSTPYTGKGPAGTYVERPVADTAVAVWHPAEAVASDPGWWLGATMLTGEGWHTVAPARVLVTMPRPRPAAKLRLLAEASQSLGQGPRQLGVRPTLWCADAINAWLKRIGEKGTGSALAASFANYGKAAKPGPGVIALKPRKGGSGHVVIVKAIKGKTLIAISPNHNGKVREARYPLRVFYAFRAPA